MKLLQRYVLMELLRVFTLLVIGLTLLLVVVGVVGEAAKSGLGPKQIVEILPYVVPGLLPFTIPATLLLTTCVVYGRMSGDQEITATKAAGVSVMALLWPALILAAFLSLATFILTDQFIPWSRVNIQRIVTEAMEEIFLDILRTKQQLNDVDRGISITVMGVDGKKLIQPTFQYESKGGNRVTIQAREATIRFDVPKKIAWLNLYQADIATSGKVAVKIERDTRPFPLPMTAEEERPRNITIDSIRREMSELNNKRNERDQTVLALSAFALSQGNYFQLNDPRLRDHGIVTDGLLVRYKKLETEVHTRLALACSCFFFVLVGSPFSILQGKRQFLTNFFLCFVPILLVYYPVVLLTQNLAKNDDLDPAWGMWIGNGILLVVGLWIFRKVLKH
jgi:lipopolysaccharide export system permease protein